MKNALKGLVVAIMAAWLGFASTPAIAMPPVAAAQAVQTQSVNKDVVKARLVCTPWRGCYYTHPHYYYYRRPVYHYRYYHVRRCHVHVYYRHGYRHVVRRCY